MGAKKACPSRGRYLQLFTLTSEIWGTRVGDEDFTMFIHKNVGSVTSQLRVISDWSGWVGAQARCSASSRSTPYSFTTINTGDR